MKAVIKYDTMFVVCDYTLEDLKKVEKARPSAMVLYDHDNNEIFRVHAEDNRYGSISENGILFGRRSFEDGKAIFETNCFESSADATKAEIVKWYGPAFARLKKVEEQIAQALVEIKAEEEAVADMIIVETEAPTEDEVDFPEE